MTGALLFVCGLAAAPVLTSWLYFRRYQVTRPPIGVINLADMAIVMAAIVMLPYLYLAVPRWLVGGLFVAGMLSVLYFTFEPVLQRRALVLLATLCVAAADIGSLLRFGPRSAGFLLVNDLALVLIVTGAANLWAQGGLKARDAATLAAALAAYDLVATGLLPVTSRMLHQVTGLPFQPVLAWPAPGDETWLGIGMGDLLLASLFPLVARRAYGQWAGTVSLALGLGTVVALLVLFAVVRRAQVFPVMVVLGPIIVLQYALWQRRRGCERTTHQYLQAEPWAVNLGTPAVGLSAVTHSERVHSHESHARPRESLEEI